MRPFPRPTDHFFRFVTIATNTSSTEPHAPQAFSEQKRGDFSNAIASETDFFRGELVSYAATLDDAIRFCQQVDASNLSFQGSSNAGLEWIGVNVTMMFYLHTDTPNQRSCFFQPGRIVNTASSFHTGGINVLMCDGSVTFVSNSVDRNIWRAAGTRDGQESVGAL